MNTETVQVPICLNAESCVAVLQITVFKRGAFDTPIKVSEEDVLDVLRQAGSPEAKVLKPDEYTGCKVVGCKEPVSVTASDLGGALGGLRYTGTWQGAAVGAGVFSGLNAWAQYVDNH
jgi:hypothetical protein